MLVHPKGTRARQPFRLARWQRDDIIRPIFGTVVYDRRLRRWVRRYNLAWLEIARKNGKTTLMAGIALVLLCADDELEAEIYGCACDRDQATLVYQTAKRMVELSPVLSHRLQVIDSRKRIVDTRTGSYYQVIASDAAGNLGQNPHGILFDEIIAQRSRELWDALVTGYGARAQPLMIAATTAGNDTSSFAYEEHLLSERIARDPDIDPRRFTYIRNTPMDADWRDETNWGHANPGLRDFLNPQTLRDEARTADQSLALQNRFRQFRLNQWVRQVTRWLDLTLWDQNAGLVNEAALAGRECYAGLDLASTSDFTAWVLIFPPAPGEPDDGPVQVLARFFLPDKAVHARTAMAHQLDAWQHAGWLHTSPGDVLDYDLVRDRIDADASRFVIRSVGYDRWNANEVVTWATERGLAMHGIAQTTTALNAPSKELERLLGQRRLRHGGNGVLRWMADNVTVFTDSNEGIKPDKRKSTEKIDGIVALVMSIHEMLAEPASSVIAEVVGAE